MYIGIIKGHKKGTDILIERVIKGKDYRSFISDFNNVYYPLLEKKTIIDRIIIERINKKEG